jgi:hypothetical protein
MSEAHVLALVARYPHPSALARRAADATVFEGIRRLQAQGLVTRRGGLYRLTRHGAREDAVSKSLARLVTRTAFES